MRDLIEHYKTMISANLFEGERRQARLLTARLKDPSNEGLRAAFDVATEKLKRRDKAMARKAKSKAFIDAVQKNPHLSYNAMFNRSAGISDRQTKQRRARMGRLEKGNP
jgi:hypothetical protein